MIDIDEVQREIERLENGNTTYSAIEKLALLHIVNDRYNSKKITSKSYSMAAEKTKSEFTLAVEGAPMEKVLAILDQHMTCIKALYPKEYAAIMRKITE